MGIRGPDQAHPEAEIPLSGPEAELFQRRVSGASTGQTGRLSACARHLLLRRGLRDRRHRQQDLRGEGMKRAVLLLVLVGLLPAPAARASYDPLGGGATRLVLGKRFVAFLNQAGGRVSAVGGGRKHGRTLIFPVSGGHLDPSAAAGEVDQRGSLVLRSPRSRVLMRKLVVRTTHAPLVAKVGGSQLKVATSAATDAKRDGFATVFSSHH